VFGGWARKQASVTSAALGNTVKGAHAPTGQNRILVVPRWGGHTFGNLHLPRSTRRAEREPRSARSQVTRAKCERGWRQSRRTLPRAAVTRAATRTPAALGRAAYFARLPPRNLHPTFPPGAPNPKQVFKAISRRLRDYHERHLRYMPHQRKTPKYQEPGNKSQVRTRMAPK